jgi:spermidine/putrescine transport system ATP-binding protein
MSDRIAVMSRGKVLQVGSPREIYDHPAERFVADFIGDANMLAADLLQANGAVARVRLAGGLEVPARMPPGAPSAGRVTVVVRPEHATLTPDLAAPGLAATVTSAVYVGTDMQYHLALVGGEPMVVRSQNSHADAPAWQPGDALRVVIGDHAVQVLRD